jgi:hypothetical protein
MIIDFPTETIAVTAEVAIEALDAEVSAVSIHIVDRNTWAFAISGPQFPSLLAFASREN